MRFEPAADVQAQVARILRGLEEHMSHIDPSRVVCMRSSGSKSSAIARCWSLPKIWQRALGEQAHYIIEVISGRFDHLSEDDKDRVLIHELLHIPKTFSGGLRPHSGFVTINRRTVEKVYRVYVAAKKSESAMLC